jgi:hypothetical protein
MFDKIDFNIGDRLNNKTSVFTAPKRGVYQFMASVLPTTRSRYPLRFIPSSRSRHPYRFYSLREAVTFYIMKGTTPYTRVQSNPIAKSTQVSKTVLILLNKDETVYLKIALGGARGFSRYTTFGGYLVRALWWNCFVVHSETVFFFVRIFKNFKLCFFLSWHQFIA